MNDTRQDVATVGGGCFWCLDAAYRLIRGVTKVESGYAGGARPNPTYEQVCSGATGHAEVVQITYDPSIVTYRDLLDVFFTIHDPTQLNRQGGDVGTQYRSAIFPHNDEQRKEAERAIAELEASGAWDARIVTTIEPLTAFYSAETYHQDYYSRNSRQPYCQGVIAPKIAKLRKQHFERLAV
jgi:peptide-methionine (S)-S-oxide reductase